MRSPDQQPLRRVFMWVKVQKGTITSLATFPPARGAGALGHQVSCRIGKPFADRGGLSVQRPFRRHYVDVVSSSKSGENGLFQFCVHDKRVEKGLFTADDDSRNFSGAPESSRSGRR